MRQFENAEVSATEQSINTDRYCNSLWPTVVFVFCCLGIAWILVHYLSALYKLASARTTTGNKQPPFMLYLKLSQAQLCMQMKNFCKTQVTMVTMNDTLCSNLNIYPSNEPCSSLKKLHKRNLCFKKCTQVGNTLRNLLGDSSDRSCHLSSTV